MTAISDFLENKLLDHVLRSASPYTAPAAHFLALFTTDPTDADVGTEVTPVGAYARVDLDLDPSFNSASSGGVIANTSDIIFPTATAAWGTVTHVGIYDASIAGNLLFHGPLTATRTVLNGQTFTIPTGSLVVTLS